MTTAEWQCTHCDTTNRKLVAAEGDRVDDRCVTCGRRHIVVRAERPTVWTATEKT